MTKASERMDVVVLSSTGLVRALVSAGLSMPYAQAAAHLFMPHLAAQEQVDLRAWEGARRRTSPQKRIARKRASAMLKMINKELDRLCDRAEAEEHAMHARRGSGVALLGMLREEHQVQKRNLRARHLFLLTSNMRTTPPEA